MARDFFWLLCVLVCARVTLCQIGFFPQRDDQRYGTSFFPQNSGSPRRISDRLSNILNLLPHRHNNQRNPYYQRPGIITDTDSNQYGRPNSNNQYNQNYGYKNQYGESVIFPNQGGFNNPNNQNKPIVFPNSEPAEIIVIEYEPDKVNVDINNDKTNGNPGSINNGGNISNGSNQPNNDNKINGNREPKTDDINGIPNDNVNFGNYQNENSGTSSNNVQTETTSSANVPLPSDNIPVEPPPRPVNQDNSGNFITNPPLNPVATSGYDVHFVDASSNEPSTLPPLKPIAQNNGLNFGNSPFTTLKPLTPVPTPKSRDTLNFEPISVFSEPCQTVTGDVGSCINIFKCDTYLRILQEQRNSPATAQLLRQAHCGFDNNDPKVCCPIPGIPTGVPTTTTTTTTTTTSTVTTTTTTTLPPSTESPSTATDGDYLTALPSPPECGVSNATLSRVVGGINAKLGDFPWMALLGYKDKRHPNTRWLCGGSLVSSRHVLTAAHCIHAHEEDLYLVRLGELDISTDDDGATPIDVLIKKKIKHEQYSSQSFTNDIGLLVLEKDVVFTDLIRPICIPSPVELRSQTFEDFNPIIAGWGDTEFRGPAATHLQVLQLPVVSNEFCADAYRQYKAQRIDERVLCAGYKSGGKDACQGDSGGPLMQPIWDKKNFVTYFYQIGVVSFGKGCANAGFPGVYSRVTHFVPWLQQNLLGS